MQQNSSWVTFEQPDGTHAGLICPACAAASPFHTLENERAVPVTTQVDDLKCCNVCDIEFRCYQEAQDVMDEVDNAETLRKILVDAFGTVLMMLTYVAFVALVAYMLGAYFDIL